MAWGVRWGGAGWGGGGAADSSFRPTSNLLSGWRPQFHRQHTSSSPITSTGKEKSARVYARVLLSSFLNFRPDARLPAEPPSSRRWAHRRRSGPRVNECPDKVLLPDRDPADEAPWDTTSNSGGGLAVARPTPFPPALSSSPWWRRRGCCSGVGAASLEVDSRKMGTSRKPPSASCGGGSPPSLSKGVGPPGHFTAAGGRRSKASRRISAAPTKRPLRSGDMTSAICPHDGPKYTCMQIFSTGKEGHSSNLSGPWT